MTNMKKYIKPEIKSRRIDLENSVLAGSIGVITDDDPAKKPALSKGSFFDDDEEEEASEANRGYAPYSVWGE
ncbi:hypothetical protein HMPREF1199_01409 [Hoylesella oralis CC98A]|nr:hypothetical protein HMPREF1199_01405 [Hoylesella oralis CC98A]ETD18591.1 hypothetical protein HMPREF1199_01409 [Hoylesella oralis CC98A]